MPVLAPLHGPLHFPTLSIRPWSFSFDSTRCLLTDVGSTRPFTSTLTPDNTDNTTAVHPKTGRVCVPIDPANVREFDPFTVPTVGELARQIDSYDKEHGAEVSSVLVCLAWGF